MSPEPLPAKEYGTPSRPSTQEFDDEELLIELLLLRLCTAGAAADKACGAIVRSAACAAGNLPKAGRPHASASNNTNTPSNRKKPLPVRE